MTPTLHCFERFAAAFATWPLTFGRLAFNHQQIAVPGNALIPDAGPVRDYFEHMVLVDKPTIGGDFHLCLFGPLELAGAQAGWDCSDHDDPAWGWRTGFTVFAERHGDVLVYDRDRQDDALFGAIQKRSFKVADDLCALLRALQAGMAVTIDEFDDDTCGEDQDYKPEFLARVAQTVGEIKGIEVAGFMKFFFE